MDRLKKQLQQNIDNICYHCDLLDGGCVGEDECDRIQSEIASYDRVCMQAVDERMGK